MLPGRDEDKLAEVGDTPVLQREKTGVQAAVACLNYLEVVENERRHVRLPVPQRVRVVEPLVHRLEHRVGVTRATVGLCHCLDNRKPAGPRRARVLHARLPAALPELAHVARTLYPAGVQEHDPAVRVEEAAETDDRLALRPVLGQVYALCDRDVQLSGLDLLEGVEVVIRLDDLDIQTVLREEPHLACNNQGHVVWIC
eukprot:CAMPEP_0179348482 /NCGR_PEP_ID=MMETSP0797-20121207/73722_1 /TAXON_ID=47934 /ORGANISM="Dinophysis acuminata, Strain DAEP01" /LENGTH=198 /DNA_ID=CAMNT_0021063283 /DNA_START=273 /DNA_END=866 /DNA_ORIENTATION=-